LVILIGGATRSGKSILSRRLAANLGWPILSLDVLKMGLSRAVPSLGIDPASPSAAVGRVMWPLIRAMLENAVETASDYIFEGDMLLPHQVAELQATRTGEVVACFLGYRHLQPEQKLAAIRRYGGLPNDWLNEHDDRYILHEVRLGIAASDEVALDAERHGFLYFDGSAGFETMVDEAVANLQSHRGPT